jgi:serine/threonine protein kinase
MDNMDPVTFGKLMVQLGLITEEQYQEALQKTRTLAETQNPDLWQFIRVLERKSLLTPFMRHKLLKGDIDGYILGGYRLLYKIASGSFGRVYRADDPRSGRVVAIKVLRRRWSEDQQRIDLFIREGKMGLSLKHPNIVEVLAMSQDPSSKAYFIVMEFVEGGNLREILQIRKRLTVSESLKLLDDMTSGLKYAYAQGLTHRDLKLTNVLISSSGEAKLVDFGLAQMFALMGKEEERVDRTVDYAGLERATGASFGDVRSDIYFLGCIFAEMLTGRSPIAMSRDRHQRMRRQRFVEVALPTRDEVEAPPSVFALVETMMAFNPQQRFQTPAQLLDAVRAARAEVDGTGGGKATPRSIFIVESDERLQDALRDRFKEMGFRVLLSSDPSRALDRFRQQPYEALIVDVGTTGEEGLFLLDQIHADATRKGARCASIAILSEEQADWTGRISRRNGAAALVRPVTLKQLRNTLHQLIQKKA